MDAPAARPKENASATAQQAAPQKYGFRKLNSFRAASVAVMQSMALSKSAKESAELEKADSSVPVEPADEGSAVTSLDHAGANETSKPILSKSTSLRFQRVWEIAKAKRFDPVRSLATLRHEFGEHGGINMSVEASATFTVMEPEVLQDIFTGKLGPDNDFYVYSRHFNPTVLTLSKQLAAMEGTEAAYCTASGIAAIASTILQICNSGDHVVASSRLYGGTHALLAELLPRMANITATFVEILDHAEVEAAIEPGRTKMLFFETIANPTLVVADIPALAAIGHRHSLQVVVDNTFAPMVVSPAVHGADIVVHSISKFISGNSDLIAGVVCGPHSLIASMMDLHNGTIMLLGPTIDATVAGKISGRLPHLALRMREHCARALEFSKRLHALGLNVLYPGLSSHPQSQTLNKLNNKIFGYGGMVCLDLGTQQLAYDLMRYLQNNSQFGFMAVSLGYHDTLMSCSSSSTSSELTQEELTTAGISPGLIRFSIGFTGSLEQRWNQMLDALIALKLAPAGAQKKAEDREWATVGYI